MGSAAFRIFPSLILALMTVAPPAALGDSQEARLDGFRRKVRLRLASIRAADAQDAGGTGELYASLRLEDGIERGLISRHRPVDVTDGERYSIRESDWADWVPIPARQIAAGKFVARVTLLDHDISPHDAIVRDWALAFDLPGSYQGAKTLSRAFKLYRRPDGRGFVSKKPGEGAAPYLELEFALEIKDRDPVEWDWDHAMKLIGAASPGGSFTVSLQDSPREARDGYQSKIQAARDWILANEPRLRAEGIYAGIVDRFNRMVESAPRVILRDRHIPRKKPVALLSGSEAKGILIPE